MHGFLGRAESEVGKFGHELIWGGRCLSTLGRDGAWVEWDTWVLSRVMGLAGPRQRMFGFSFDSATWEQDAWRLGLRGEMWV